MRIVENIKGRNMLQYQIVIKKERKFTDKHCFDVSVLLAIC